ncbi:MAG TPA: di-trans,poly-cis-decaprenylcistransferase [Candidatus Altiarchaeales archaeon]|nr:di-trans,poly-cis-decaprenylcistransferase [Candidatus Altiarchaeales archaeon]
MHIGLIPDGNRRYMAKRGINNLSKSYDMGIERFHEFLQWCIKKDVDEVTIYALSLENIESRSDSEIETLVGVFNEHALEALNDPRIHESKVRINVCGNLDAIKGIDGGMMASKMLENLKNLVESTRGYGALKLNLAIGYGGRQEILHAAKKISENNEEYTEENFKKYLWVGGYPEIIIRTSESRLSNFLTWQSAYSEIYFVDKLWQEFSEEDLDGILEDFNARERRFGR